MIRKCFIIGSAVLGLAAIAGPVSAGTVGSPLGIQGKSSAASMINAIESMYDPQVGSGHGAGSASVEGDSLAFGNGITAKLTGNLSQGNLFSSLGQSEVSSFVLPASSGPNVIFTSLSGQANSKLGIRYLSPMFNDEAVLGYLPPILDIPWHDLTMPLESNGRLSTNQSLANRLWQAQVAISPSETELVTFVLMRFGHAYRCQELVTLIEPKTVPPPVTPPPPVNPNPPVTPAGPGTPIEPSTPPVGPPPNNPTPDVPVVVPAPEALGTGLLTLAGIAVVGLFRWRKRLV